MRVNARVSGTLSPLFALREELKLSEDRRSVKRRAPKKQINEQDIERRTVFVVCEVRVCDQSLCVAGWAERARHHCEF